MVNMAETEPMFLGGVRLGASAELNGSPPGESDSDGELGTAVAVQTLPKRNKRKNFQPRSIYLPEDGEPMEEGGVLDLSERSPKRIREEETDSSSDGEGGAAPIDLSKPSRPDDSTPGTPNIRLRTDLLQVPPGHYLQAFLGTGEATDLREYAQNTVKELLEIYGLNSAEVAESITNNVPIANFSSGKILEGVSSGDTRGSTTTEIQEPPTPPRTPPTGSTTPGLPALKELSIKSAGTPVTTSGPSPATTTSVSSSSTSTSSFASRVTVPGNMASILALANSLPSSPNSERAAAPATPTTPSTSSPRDTPQQSPMLNVARQTSTSIIPNVPRDGKSLAPIDYSRYVRRFVSSLECGSQYCKELNYREHFHCLECNSRVFVKKEEMIRHFKWHKKRDESLQHGFMRYSPSDDCSDRYPTCGHNRKQTHYHCIQGNCDKVYISTSDVQMHANYHRKDSAIIQEGFQRLRATEECRTPHCAFFGQRTTHFHCRRDSCQFTFKNKADMEKHKTYHIKDEALARDGFKKFLKPDACGFPNCRFSQVCNHIHCVRDGCNYVLHSSGQLLSHKRKHEKKDCEIAYRKYKLAQQAVVNIGNLEHNDMSPGTSMQLMQGTSLAAFSALHDSFSNSSNDSRTSPQLSSTQLKLSSVGTQSMCDLSNSLSEFGDDEFGTSRYIDGYMGGQGCTQGSTCQLNMTEHYHCRDSGCNMSFRCRETAEGHARMHEAQDRVSDFYQEGCYNLCNETCPSEKHYHCTWDGCSEVVLPSDRFEHFRSHEISAQQNNSLELLFRRKRGRPPKNRVIEVWNDYASGSSSDSPQAIFTSFKLPKPTPGTNLPMELSAHPGSPPHSSSGNLDKSTIQMLEMHGFQCFREACPDPLCTLANKPTHFHCVRPRCFFTTDNEEFLIAHARDFHDNIEILDGFLFFDRSVDCRLENCPSNKVNRHFHCTVRNCGYSFVRYSQMALHKAQHENTEVRPQSPPNSQSDQNEVQENKMLSPKMEISPRSQESYASEEYETNATRPTEPIKSEIKAEVISNVDNPALPEWMAVEKHEKYGPDSTCSRPFCKLKRKEHYHCNACNQAFSEVDKLKPHIAKHSPGAIPTSLIKENNNNNDEPVIQSTNQTQPSSGVSTPSHSTPNAVITSAMSHSTPPSHLAGVAPLLPLNLEGQEIMPPPHFPGFSAAMAAAVANQQLAMMTSQGIPFIPHAMPGLYTSPSGLMFAPPGFGPHPSALVNNGLLESARASVLASTDPNGDISLPRRSLSPTRDINSEAKKARVQTSMRMLKDEPVPEGYVRYRFNEDCRYAHCGYREHQTHFHCMRMDCGYSFCDKTRFVQHTARHERLDTLMGGDFQQFRANVSCGRADCSYASQLGSTQNKASHFHCLKCDFVCTDTNKVVAHRRQHQKLDNIMAAGFEKFTPSQPCNASDTCVHSGKSTHYHCLSCQYAVLGLSQMTAHKYRHME